MTGPTMKSDSQLKADVLAELLWEPALRSGEIHVNAHDGVITLHGQVEHYADKFAAERAVQRVDGVKAIAEELKVSYTGVQQLTDTEIAESVVKSLKWHVWVPDSVQATIEDGWVTIRGEVHWGFQRQSAEDAVRYLIGVKGVSNNITLKPELQALLVKEAIEKSLHRNSEIDAKDVRITASEGKVTLAGSVHSWDERRQAYAAAWNAPGVTSVENHLSVTN
jgi:osmotically-inducible protein OsmY